MNKLLAKLTDISPVALIALLFVIWRIHLELLLYAAGLFIPLKEGFLGPIPWANFDGVHYISIATWDYAQYEQAFFPVYPALMRYGTAITNLPPATIGYIISNFSFFLFLVLFYRLLDRVLHSRKDRKAIILRTMVFLLFFPTSYYFACVYTESFFLLLIISSFYLLMKGRFYLYGIVASIASGTRLIGAFLLVPIGLILYMFKMVKTNNDPLFFIHAQPAFGAGRSGGELIFLPQVYWRYINIFLTVPIASYDYWITALEFMSFNGALVLLYVAWKKKLPKLWIAFSSAAIIGPTFTGSLSSMPRYILIAFPIFVVFGMLSTKWRYLLFVFNYLLFCLLTMLFVRGWWVS